MRRRNNHLAARWRKHGKAACLTLDMRSPATMSLITEDTTNNAYPGIGDIDRIFRELMVIRTNMVAEMARSQLRLDEIHINHQKREVAPNKLACQRDMRR